MNLHQLIATQNDCYKAGKHIVPRGIMVHSTGCNNPNLNRYVGPDDGLLGSNTYKNYWNQPGSRKCVHAFIGKMKDGTVATYQILPWNHLAWHCAGSGNSTHIAFEMCEDGLQNAAYLRAVWAEATELCAYLAKMYSIPVKSIVGHYEGHDMGIANNHGDPRNWFIRHGVTMAMFRADVQKLLDGGTVNPPIPEEVLNMTGYDAKVVTQYAAGLSIWSTKGKAASLIKVARDEIVHVVTDHQDGWVTATYKGVTGFADKKYLFAIPADPPVVIPPVPPSDTITIPRSAAQALFDALSVALK